jgi:hypothetical protein
MKHRRYSKRSRSIRQAESARKDRSEECPRCHAVYDGDECWNCQAQETSANEPPIQVSE